VLFGAATEENNTGGLTQLASFESHAGKKAALYGMYKSFYWDPNFPTSEATTVRNHGSVPMITWEPWNPSNGVNQPTYALNTITAGNYDSMIRTWATQIKTFGSPVWLRFAHEMNSDWYPWAEGVNGNGAGSYAAAYRHVHDVFTAAGVTNVKWVWSPNVVMDGVGSSLTSLYPGDAYVDMVGIDGYNWGASASWATWQTPASVFGATLSQVRAITHRGIVIGETASAEAGGSKATWVKDFFSFVKANTDIKAFVWFNIQKETDWRIESSATAQAAFASAVSDATFVAAS
jgi:beta-mannanase